MKLSLLLLLLTISTFPQGKWQKLNGPEGAVISALLTKGDSIIMGTGFYKALIYYSTNKGSSWERSDFKKESRINGFVFSDDGGIIAAAGLNGLYKTFDLKKWQIVYNNGDEYWSIGKDLKGNIYAGSDEGRIVKSTNNGSTWDLEVSNLGMVHQFIIIDSTLYAGAWKKLLKKGYNSLNWTIIPFDSLYYIKIFSDELGNLFCNDNNDIIMSTDGGFHWVYRDVNNFFGKNQIDECIYNIRIIASCPDETRWFGDGWGIALSDDKGLTWRWSNNGLPPHFSGAYKLAKSGSDTYASILEAGLFKSTDYGDSWFPVNKGIYAANAIDITFDSEGNMYAACWSNGIFKSTNKGVTWQIMTNGITNSYFYSIISDDKDNLLAGTDHGTFRSTDKGESWILINNYFFYRFYKDRFNRIYGIRYGSGLYRSTDIGDTWIRLDNGFNNSSVFGFAMDDKDDLYAGINSGIIYKSTDDGISWMQVFQSSVATSGIDYIVCSKKGIIYASNIYEGILRSTDHGGTWKVVLSDNTYQVRYPLDINMNDEIFAANYYSFYKSTNNGDTWADVTDNLQYTKVQKIGFDNEGKMYLATDESVWTEAPDSTVSISEFITFPKEYSLEQNYPNPFNPVTTIKYSIPVSGQVIIKVFNTLGKEVLILVNETKSAGSYEVNFDGSLLPSGAYFYRIQAGSFTQTKKMILLK